ncbi:MAG: pilus assembly protein PilX [Oscillospiraceae bacterium]|nr:pilus assembly protein PilX [Oscillospiraceae bacterium]
MRKWNAVLSMGILVLFLVHAVAGGFQLAGVIPGGNRILSIAAYLMTVLVLIHAVLGIILTVQTLKTQKRAGVSYFRENTLFWLRRISGFAVMFLLLAHVLIFEGTRRGGVFRLRFFGRVQLLSQILLVLAVAVHVLSNIRPLMTALGIRKYRRFLLDLLLILSVLLLFAGAAFVVYYIRWQAI